MLFALNKEWERNPPTHYTLQIIAAILGYKSKEAERGNLSDLAAFSTGAG